ncbi:hypothetical protein HMN09_01318900 [Mycena chlorophos]|uniref:Uncharacterized protein n=1 Tax=Mycena chlorophos TaxID=658473 RepID=A0A8H6VVA0_MYCCL|nr:hypothetical protein HMN09_01318900 [Mycena chlorophos]
MAKMSFKSSQEPARAHLDITSAAPPRTPSSCNAQLVSETCSAYPHPTILPCGTRHIHFPGFQFAAPLVPDVDLYDPSGTRSRKTLSWMFRTAAMPPPLSTRISSSEDVRVDEEQVGVPGGAEAHPAIPGFGGAGRAFTKLNVAHLKTSLTTEPTLIDAAGTVRLQRAVEETHSSPSPTENWVQSSSQSRFSSRRGRFSTHKRGLLMITLTSRSSSLSSPSPSSSSTAALPPAIAEAINAQVLSVAKDMHWSTRQNVVEHRAAATRTSSTTPPLRSVIANPNPTHCCIDHGASGCVFRFTHRSKIAHAPRPFRLFNAGLVERFCGHARPSSLNPSTSLDGCGIVACRPWLRFLVRVQRQERATHFSEASSSAPMFHSQTRRLTTRGCAEAIRVLFVVQLVELEDLHVKEVVFVSNQCLVKKEVNNHAPGLDVDAVLLQQHHHRRRRRSIRGFVVKEHQENPPRTFVLRRARSCRCVVVVVIEHDVLRYKRGVKMSPTYSTTIRSRRHSQCRKTPSASSKHRSAASKTTHLSAVVLDVFPPSEPFFRALFESRKRSIEEEGAT